MKLLQLNVTANWGSTGKIAEGIGQSAISQGWESVIAYGRYLNPSQSELIKVGNRSAVYAHYAKARFFDSEGLGSKNATRRLIKWIDDYNPDIIHLHNIHDHWLNYSLLFQYFATINTPIVWTFHDCWAFTGGCAYFDIPNCEKWEYECHNCILRKGLCTDRSKRNFNLKKKLISKFADRLTIVPVSNWINDLCRESFLKNVRSRIIHNGIDITKFKPCSPKSAKPLILGVALPWSERKGLYEMIKLRDHLPVDRYDMVLIGLSQKQIDMLPESIKCIERTQDIHELANWYSKSWAFVNTTLSDNFPTVNLEALACGTPVITYQTGGSAEAIDDKTGFSVKKGDVKALADKIIEICNNRVKYTPEQCHKRADAYFNQNTQFQKYIELYEDLLN